MKKLMSKKPIKIFMTILGVLLLLASVFLIRIAFTDITYSNLNNDDSLNKTVNYLQESGVKEENIEVLKKQVDFTNTFLSEYPDLQGDFKTQKGTYVKYDRDLAYNLFVKARTYDDVNCRIAAWNLIKDTVKVDPMPGDIEYTEESILEYNPMTGFKKGDKEQFWGVFKGIPAGLVNTTRGYSKVIKEEWDKRNLEFEDSNRKLVSCFMYNFEEKWLEAVHAGVMIEQDDQIVFIEKVNPKEPFQVSIFENEKELKFYLKQRLLSYLVVQPIIMVNDELM
ncbi:MAG: DUF4300 family protein [Peptostreptococcaceae bacterium]